jgi:hypothetical protein
MGSSCGSVRTVLAVVVPGKRLFGKWCVREEVGEVGRREPLDVPDAEITKNIVKAGRRLLANEAAKALFELVLKCQSRELSQHCTLLILRNSIKPYADDVYCDS